MIIAITGHKQAGKNTIAEMLINIAQLYGIEFECHSFAYKLKQITSILTDCKLSDLENNKFKETKYIPEFLFPFLQEGDTPNYSTFLQRFGTDILRKYNTDLWIDSILNSYNNTQNWIITDTRFENEAKRIKEIDLNSIIIKIVRPDNQEIDNHSSETSIDCINEDITIINDGTIQDLQKKVLNIWSQIYNTIHC
jgi:hypothetical protein